MKRPILRRSHEEPVFSERTGRLVVETNMPNGFQTRSVHGSETFNVGKTLREKTGRPVVDHDNLSHEKIMVNEADMDFQDFHILL